MQNIKSHYWTRFLLAARARRNTLDIEQPLRAELLSGAQIELHASDLAHSHDSNDAGGSDQLLLRLTDNTKQITAVSGLVVEAIKAGRQITPAAEWLLDNQQLINDQIETTRRHLPKGYSRGLPRLVKGASSGLPRVYDLALEVISRTDARLDADVLLRFVAAYQRVTPLQLGELWAFPIMLRLALIENLRRVATRLALSLTQRNLADYWADQMTQTAERSPTDLIVVIADMARSQPPMESAFVAELVRRLQGQGPALALPLTWVEQRLAQSGHTTEQLIYGEIQNQAADQVSVSNSIGSMRFLETMNWRKFVEELSAVEKILLHDPINAYTQMDFATRDHYRHSVERIAKKSLLDESQIAAKAIELAQAAVADGDDQRRRHVGYYLVGKGRKELEKVAGMKRSLASRMANITDRYPLSIYLGAVAALSGLYSLRLISHAYHDPISLPLFASICALVVLTASYPALAVVNWISTMLATPDTMARLNLTSGIPDSLRTMVAIPTLINSRKSVDSLIEGLEVRFLANPDRNLFFCLLTDFTDAQQELKEGDAELVEYASHAVTALNAKYAADHGYRFFLFHRPRAYNAQEKVWMGYERKRGKLGALNNYLLHGDRTPFLNITGPEALLQGVRYVITLDTDTELPREAARQFISVMGHPLNKPLYDTKLRRITDGYGIIQPRVATSLPGTSASLYARLSGGEPGIDPYTRTISDVYQDVFGEGSFVGKGIYDIAAFEQTLADRLPENRILSHDLLEGCYARSGLLSDVQLYEEYPSHYSADVSRRHRWIRGDWQIAAWILPYTPGHNGKRERNPLSALSRWKIFDNLRRSLIPQAIVALLLISWFALSGPMAATLIIIFMLMITPVCTTLFDLFNKSPDVLLTQHLRGSFLAARRHFSHALLTLLCLPHEAFYQSDAILRAGWRLLVSRYKLLEWNPSGNSMRPAGDSVVASYSSMWMVPAFALLIAILLFVLKPASLPAASMLLLPWLASPAVLWWLSRPRSSQTVKLTIEQHAYLGTLSRKIWAFFEDYVGHEDNWLPPDNMQEYPVTVVAHRTSPTNIGMALLANLTAYDFGYIPLGQMIERTENTFRTLDRLERYQGHFYNWYDTVSLRPLLPMYVSSVDSGNLAGHLLTLRTGLLELADAPLIHPRLYKGLQDTLNLVLDQATHGKNEHLVACQKLIGGLEAATPHTLAMALDEIAAHVTSYKKSVHEENDWLLPLSRQLAQLRADILLLMPWAITHDIAGLSLNLKQLAQLEDNAHGINADMLVAARSEAQRRLRVIESLALQCAELSRMELGFLFDNEKNLLAIGYNVSDRRRDVHFYDLLASEMRLGTFVGIAQGQIPQESWFALGRRLSKAGGEPVLISWSGSMFEYLMPLLVMPTYDNTLLDQTYKASVRRQIEYGAQRNTPWGISESGYHLFDANLNYQYRAFGVPGLGIKRGLADDMVIAPYASVMGLMVEPEAACRNLQAMDELGFENRYGFYEAIDYTVARLPRKKAHAVIRSYMAHHQGMSFLSLSYFLLGQPMQRRFVADPSFQATLLLLHEKVPKATIFYSDVNDVEVTRIASNQNTESTVRILDTAQTPTPEVQLLSNGRYHVMVTNAGGSASRWRDLAVTRWREDATRDNWGAFCYLRDRTSGQFWSATVQPTLKTPRSYEVIFSEGRAEFKRKDEHFDTHTEILVSPEDDIEMRRTKVTNRSRHRRSIEITTYAEVVMAPAASDASHPAFSNLFVQTEILESQQAILCTRRPRSAGERPPYMFHLVSTHGAVIEEISYETDRSKFIGRGNDLSNPAALSDFAPLSGSQGSVLDPIVAIRHLVILEPEQTITFDLIYGMAEDRETSLHLIAKYQDYHLTDRVLELAWTHNQVILRQLNATEVDAQVYGRLAGAVIYANAVLRANATTIIKNRRGQSGLWSYAISGDLPIVLVKIRNASNIDLVRQMVQAHAYWRLKGLVVDLVIWNEDQAGYRQVLQEQILGLIAAGLEANVLEKPGGIFVRPGDQISPEDYVLIESVARVILTDENGTLSEQIIRPHLRSVRIPAFVPSDAPAADRQMLTLPNNLQLDNGYGGFSPDGNEYVILSKPDRQTPMPWSNVLANPKMGTVISENGQAYTWCENAHMYRLTPWNNDPVSDTSGEAFYIRDEETGEYWSPAPRPVVSSLPYITRHGFGYSIFEHVENGIHSEMRVYVDANEAVKFTVIKLRNLSDRPREISVTGYVEWVLGDLRTKSAMHIVTESDPNSGAILARNSYNTPFANRIAFFDVDDINRSITADRREFIGRNGSLGRPLAMERAHLSGKIGAGLDPCAAIQVPFKLPVGQEKEIAFKLGIANEPVTDVSAFIRRFKGMGVVKAALERVRTHWRDTLGAVQVETPDRAVNLMANGWLMYQTIACRMWGRSGYYQSGGAYGFRDQLQDAMAVIYTKPQLLRDHLLLCAAHQFVEGDAQHWWHPPQDRGVRTKCSDDYLWLPLAVSRYVSVTGDTGLLDEVVHFIEGRALGHEEESYYDMPIRSAQSGTIYEHCVRAINHGLRMGSHGLPLIGTCDWNDGMDRVGHLGRGESVWLAFFLYDILNKFKPIAELRGDTVFAGRCSGEAARLRQNIKDNAWDGNWYRRAYFDDGTPLGSSENEECRIDSISQSWSVLSGASDEPRMQQAMQSLNTHLIRRDSNIVLLLDPPFDKSAQNPGYIRGYVPGVRENGGQYTHAAIWAAMAFAQLGDRATTGELLHMINPINHALTAEDAKHYKVEPYVVAADVYGAPPHVGRGGWTWYTGSSGWLYRLILESVLGFNLAVDQLSFKPCLPPGWNEFKISYRYRRTLYRIHVRSGDAAAVRVDGVAQPNMQVTLKDDLQERVIEVVVP